MSKKDVACFRIVLLLCQELRTDPIAEMGPSSGILIQETPGFILTEKRILTRRVFVSLDPKISIEKAYNISSMQPPELQTWYQMHLQRAQDRVRNILEQARKPFVSSSISMSNRPKRFLTAIIVALVCATVSAVVATGMSAANSITVQKLDMEIYALKQHINDIHQVIKQQRTLLQDVLTIVEDTVVTTNLHSELIAKSTELHQSHDLFKRELLFLHDPILFHTLAFLDEVQTGMIELAGGRIPLYFVSKDIVHAMLANVDGETIEPMQLNLAFEMGSAIPLLIDPERMEICFLLAIPYVTPKNIFQMKTIYNVGTWKENIHVKVQTPDVLAFQPWIPDWYSIPILNDCEKFKDNNFQCDGKPFVYDSTNALCGIEYLKHGSETCQVTMSKTDSNALVHAILVKDKWLVSTCLKNMSVFRRDQVTNKVIALPAPVSLIKVPHNSRITIGDVTLYPVYTDVLESAIEMVDPFQNLDIPLDPNLKFLLDHKPNHTIQMSIKKDNISVDTFKYSELDTDLIDRVDWFIHVKIVIGCVMIMMLLWLIVLSIKFKTLTGTNIYKNVHSTHEPMSEMM